MKCAEDQVIFRRMTCGCTLAWAAIQLSARSKFHGRAGRNKLFMISPLILSTQLKKAAGSKTSSLFPQPTVRSEPFAARVLLLLLLDVGFLGVGQCRGICV